MEWLINGEQFNPSAPLAFPTLGQPEVWTVRNGGGGWVHPMHMHYEEHRVISRNGVPVGLDPSHPEDNGREDVVALEPSEEVKFYRNNKLQTKQVKLGTRPASFDNQATNPDQNSSPDVLP